MVYIRKKRNHTLYSVLYTICIFYNVSFAAIEVVYIFSISMELRIKLPIMTYCSLLRGKVLLDFVSIKGTVSEDKWVREGQPHIICQCLKSIKNYGIVSQLGDTLAL